MALSNMEDPQISLIELNNVKVIVKHPFLHFHKSIEITLKSGVVVGLAFNSELEREKVFSLIQNNTGRCDYNIAHEVRVLSPTHFMPENTESITVQWVRGKISNFQYLLAMNKCAGRSFNDFSRYPIMPWCVNSYDTPMIRLFEPTYFRELKKPFGLIFDNERAAAYQEHYRGMIKDKEPHPFFFGTYISNVSSVLQYLMRLEPVSKSWKGFYGRVHESPERIFHSLVKHYQSITTTSQDIKESIPEFYYLPEMFQNINKMKIEGKTSENWRIDYFDFPQWAKDNPYHFVYLNRIILESEIVTERLPQWFNLIFGNHLQGKKSLSSKNIYQPTIYPDSALKLFTSAEKKGELLALYSQIYFFGQCPLKLFDRDHPFKLKLNKPLLRPCLSTQPLETKACICSLKDNQPPPSILCCINFYRSNSVLRFLTSHNSLQYRLTTSSLILRLETKSPVNRLVSKFS